MPTSPPPGVADISPPLYDSAPDLGSDLGFPWFGWCPDGLTEAVIDRRYGDLLTDLDTDLDAADVAVSEAVEQAEAADEPLVGALVGVRVLVFPTVPAAAPLVSGSGEAA